MDMLLAVLRFGRHEQPVVIDVYSTLNFHYALACGLLCQWIGIRYFCVLHGGNLPRRLKDNPYLCNLLFGRASKLIAPSEYLKAAFTKSSYNVEVIPNGIPIKNYPFRLRDKPRPRLLWVRAFDSTYNPAMAVQVIKLLAEKYDDAVLCMVGPDRDGSMETCKRLAKELEVSERIIFTGQLSKTAWISLANEYDIFINTTNFDNTPISVIEAMALGLAVVSTNAGGVPYLIENGREGMLVEMRDINSMTTTVAELVEGRISSSELVTHARHKVEKFDYMFVAEQWKDTLI